MLLPMHTADELAQIQLALKSRIRSVGVDFRSSARITADEVAENEAGYFVPVPFGDQSLPPRIVLYRSGDLLEEVLTLAHEFGHFQSYAGKLRSQRYEEIIVGERHLWPSLPLSDRQLIIEEEVRAWDLAAVTLRALGFADEAALRTARVVALKEYVRRLDLPTGDDVAP